MAAVAQLPVIMIGLHSVGIGSAAMYSKYRRHYIVGAFIVAAIITPPEPVSQVLMAIPMLVLYEVAVLILRVRERRKKASAKQEAP